MRLSSFWPTSHKQSMPLRFSGIFADKVSVNHQYYQDAFDNDISLYPLRYNQTSIIRNAPVVDSIVKLIKDAGTQTHIHVLGVSDGSTAYSYAMAIRYELPADLKEKIAITGVDFDPAMIALANSNRIVCTKSERYRANGSMGSAFFLPSQPKILLFPYKVPWLCDDQWEQCLRKTSAPDNFGDLKKQYPKLAHVEYDNVAKSSVENGDMAWYEVIKDGFPPIHFKEMDMKDYVKENTSAELNVYDLSNTWGYLLNSTNLFTGETQANPLHNFFQLIRDIRVHNAGKLVYIIVGDTESSRLLDGLQIEGSYKKLSLKPIWENIGLSPLKQDELIDCLGCTPKVARKIYGCIWRLDTEDI